MNTITRKGWPTAIWAALVLLLAGAVGAPLAQVREERPIPDPELVLHGVGYSDAVYGDNDGALEQGEVIEMTVVVENVGNATSPAGQITAEWAPESSHDFEWIVDEVDVGPVEVRQWVSVGTLTFLIHTDKLLADGSFELSYSGGRLSYSLGDVVMGANPVDRIPLHEANIQARRAARDARYLVFTEVDPSGQYGQVAVKDLDEGSVRVLSLHPGGSFGDLVAADGWAAYTHDSISDGTILWLANLATGEVEQVARGTTNDVDPETRLALSDRYLVWKGSKNGVDCCEEEPGGSAGDDPSKPYVLVLDRQTGRYQRVGSGDGLYERSPSLSGALVSYVTTGGARLRNMEDGTDIEVMAGVSEAVITGTKVVGLSSNLGIKDLTTGDVQSVPLPSGLVTPYEDLNFIGLTAGDGWAAVYGDYLGGAYHFLVNLEDGSLGPVYRGYYEADCTSWHGKNMVYTNSAPAGGNEIFQETLPSGFGQEAAPTAVNQSVAVETDRTLADFLLPSGSPARFALHGSYPNPFRGMTTIAFDVPHTAVVDVRVYDAAGRLVRTLVSDRLESGRRQVHWDGRDRTGLRVSGGTYFVKLTAEDVTRTGKVVFLGGQ